ncbi:MAG: hypothetical protein KF833_18570 [Verrucomicrobiae bacterium]|nr:hypothetical protein [Verrucomicrobiae bacterium]
MKKKIRFDFFLLVEASSGPVRTVGIAERLDRRIEQTREARTIIHKGVGSRLARLKKLGNLRIGDFIRFNLDQPAMVAGKHIDERAVTTREDEGMAIPAAFLYDAGSNVLVYQRAKGAISTTDAFRHLFIGCESNLPLFDPILKPDVENTLKKMERPRKLEIRAHVLGMNPQDAQAASTRKFIEAARDAGTRWLTIELSVGRKRHSTLDSTGVLAMAKDWMFQRREGRLVDRLKLHADFPPEDKINTLDLLDASLVSDQYIEPTRDVEEYYHRRAEAAHKAWDEHRHRF